MSATEDLKKIVDEFPAEIARDKEKVEAATAGIAKGGKQSVLGLISLLAEPGGAASRWRGQQAGVGADGRRGTEPACGHGCAERHGDCRQGATERWHRPMVPVCCRATC